MAFGNIGTYACRDLQVDLVDYFGKNSPEFKTLGSTSLLKWLLSPQNTSGFKPIDVESIPGKQRGVAFMVDTPYCFDLCSLTADCTVARTAVIPASGEIVFDLVGDPFRVCDGDGAPTKLTFKYADMMRYCTKDDTTWMKNQIMRYIMQFEKALDKAITSQLKLQIPADWTKSVPLFIKNNTTNTAVLNPEGLFSLNQLYQNMGMDGQYGVVGGQIVNKMELFKAWACCNNAGVDMSKKDASTPWAFYDRNFDSIFGTNELVMLAPGTSQLVTWNLYKGEKAKEVTDLYTHGTIVFPATGVKADYEWVFDYNCKTWTFEIFLYAELAVVPAGGCGDAATSNGLIQITDCGNTPVIPDCPAEV